MSEPVHLDLAESELQTEEGLAKRIEEELNRVFGDKDVVIVVDNNNHWSV